MSIFGGGINLGGAIGTGFTVGGGGEGNQDEPETGFSATSGGRSGRAGGGGGSAGPAGMKQRAGETPYSFWLRVDKAAAKEQADSGKAPGIKLRYTGNRFTAAITANVGARNTANTVGGLRPGARVQTTGGFGGPAPGSSFVANETFNEIMRDARAATRSKAEVRVQKALDFLSKVLGLPGSGGSGGYGGSGGGGSAAAWKPGTPSPLLPVIAAAIRGDLSEGAGGRPPASPLGVQDTFREELKKRRQKRFQAFRALESNLQAGQLRRRR